MSGDRPKADAKIASPSAFERWELPNVGPALPGPSPRPLAPLTAAQVESMQARAYEEATRDGYRDGFERGNEEGKAKALAEQRALTGRLEAILDHLAAPLRAVDEAVEDALVAVATAVVKQLVRREIKTDPGQVVAAVRAAVGALPIGTNEVRLFLHPQDADLVRQGLPLEGDRPEWMLVEDPAMTRGGCRVVSGASRVDATVENRLAIAISSVFGGERQGDE
jgi:flagellar assembly protein FliH